MHECCGQNASDSFSINAQDLMGKEEGQVSKQKNSSESILRGLRHDAQLRETAITPATLASHTQEAQCKQYLTNRAHCHGV